MKEIAQKPESEISLTVTSQVSGVAEKTLPVASIVWLLKAIKKIVRF